MEGDLIESLLKQRRSLVIQEQKRKEAERKKDTRRKIEMGGMVIKAGLDRLDPQALYGTFLMIADVLSRRPEVVEQAGEWGRKALGEEAAKESRIPLRIVFPAAIPREMSQQLRARKFDFDRETKQWSGIGVFEKIVELVAPYSGSVSSPAPHE